MIFKTPAALNIGSNQPTDVTDGSRQTLGKGQAITFTDLPNQPISIVTYNNTGNTTPFNVAYNNQAPQAFTVESVQAQGFSLGLAYLINPAVTGANEITVSVPNTAQSDASIDVYAVSLFLPLHGIQNQEIPLNGEHVSFNGYSRAYATPPLAWYDLTIQSTETGLVGLYFTGDKVEVVAVNVPSEIQPALQQKVFFSPETGIASSDVSFSLKTGNTFSNTFYGTSSQLVYSPVSSANTTNNGQIAIQKVS